MKAWVVSVFDSKTELYSRPSFVAAVGQAVREFSDLVNDGKSDIARHPADYTLFLIGHWEDGTGMMEPLAAHQNLGNGLQYVENSAQLSLLAKEG